MSVARVSPGNCGSHELLASWLVQTPSRPEAGGMDHVVFMERLSELEDMGAEGEWRETWAGLLVLRLFNLWQLDPETARHDAPSAAAVRAVVDDLPESALIKQGLTRILETLRAPGAPQRAAIARYLAEYAAGLARGARLPLALDVHRTAALHRVHRQSRSVAFPAR